MLSLLILFLEQEADVAVHHILVFFAQTAPFHKVALLLDGQVGGGVLGIKKLLQGDAEAVADLDEGAHGRGAGFVEHGAQGGVGDAAFLGKAVYRP